VIPSLEDHLVRSVAVAEAEGGSEQIGEEGNLLDGGKETLVNGLLVGSTAGIDGLGLQIRTQIKAIR